MLVKKRVIGYQRTGEPVMGFTLPKEINLLIDSVNYFDIELSGTTLMFTSGTKVALTPKQVKEYSFEGARI